MRKRRDDIAVADMVADMAADMEVDKVADMFAGGWLIGPKLFRPEACASNT